MPIRYRTHRLSNPENPWGWIESTVLPGDFEYAEGAISSRITQTHPEDDHDLLPPAVQIRGNLGWMSPNIPKPPGLNPKITLVGRSELKRLRDAMITICKAHGID